MSALDESRFRATFALLAMIFFSVLVASRLALSQQSVPDKSQNVPLPRPSGMGTGGIHAPIKDSHSRPITAGGFVDDAPIIFADITRQGQPLRVNFEPQKMIDSQGPDF